MHEAAISPAPTAPPARPDALAAYPPPWRPHPALDAVALASNGEPVQLALPGPRSVPERVALARGLRDYVLLAVNCHGPLLRAVEGLVGAVERGELLHARREPPAEVERLLIDGKNLLAHCGRAAG